jgi:hypothetical protein
VWFNKAEIGDEEHDLGDGNCGPENAEHGTGMKSPRHDGRDEIRRQTFRDLIAGHHSGQELATGAACCLGSHECRGQYGATRVNHHPEEREVAADRPCIDIPLEIQSLNERNFISDPRRACLKRPVSVPWADSGLAAVNVLY